MSEEKYRTDLKRAYVALDILKRYNRLRNDLDAYLFDVAEWGKGDKAELPNPEDFGIEND